MHKYTVMLITSDSFKVTADGFMVSSGAAVFYNEAEKKEDEPYPDTTNTYAFASGTWSAVIKEPENESQAS